MNKFFEIHPLALLLTFWIIYDLRLQLYNRSIKKQHGEVILMQTEINYQQLGERIREKRKTMNVQQKDMAIAIGTATNHLSDIERGRKKPSLELLMRISSFLDTPVDYFLMDNPYSCRSYRINSELAATLRKCTPQSLMVIATLAQSMVSYQQSVMPAEECTYCQLKEKRIV